MHDTGSGRNDGHIFERIGTPLEELESFLIPLELDLLISTQRLGTDGTIRGISQELLT